MPVTQARVRRVRRRRSTRRRRRSTRPTWKAQGFAQDYATRSQRFIWNDGAPPTGREDHPVVLVTWDEATRYCTWRGELRGEPRRLPTEARVREGGARRQRARVSVGQRVRGRQAQQRGERSAATRRRSASTSTARARTACSTWPATCSSGRRRRFATGQMTVKGSAWEDFGGVGRGASRHGRPIDRASRDRRLSLRGAAERGRSARVLTRELAIIVHGGAGTSTPIVTRDCAKACGARPRRATRSSSRGGSALDAVVAAVRVLEDDPEFNAGTGSALTRDGTVETDASVMDGATQRVGAVAAVPDLGNAIALARAVLDAGEHVMLAGPGRVAVRGRGRHRAGAAGLARHRARAHATRRAARARQRRSGGTVGAVARDRRRPLRGGDLDRRHRRQARGSRRRLADSRRGHVGRSRAARSRRPVMARRSCASRSRERSRCARATRCDASDRLRDAAIDALRERSHRSLAARAGVIAARCRRDRSCTLAAIDCSRVDRCAVDRSALRDVDRRRATASSRQR